MVEAEGSVSLFHHSSDRTQEDSTATSHCPAGSTACPKIHILPWLGGRLRLSLSDNTVGATGFRISSCSFTGKLVFRLLVAVHDESVQEATWLAGIVSRLLCIFSFLANVVHGFFVGRVVVVEVDWGQIDVS